MKPDAARTLCAYVLVAMIFVIVIMLAIKADRNFVWLPVGLGTVAAIIGARQPT